MSTKTKSFIEKAIKIHGNKYDYSAVHYVSARKKVAIICPIHGLYYQSPDNHLRKRNCPKCAGKGWNQEDFLHETKKIHGNKYDYSRVLYKNKKSKSRLGSALES